LSAVQGTTELAARADEVGFPLFVKAAAGGGGRGLRLVDGRAELVEAIDASSREASSAFGDGTVFLEEAVTDPRHIEVQVLADHQGNVVHLFERDCSLQRRHQKVVEIAPAPHLDQALRAELCREAIAFASTIGFVGAGTVEFLVDRSGRHVFIEMNPRIQVEHTVTEEVTAIDLVQAQLRIASGERLRDLGLEQGAIETIGAALQCRITAEDPAHDFRPDTGVITTYRAPGGSGIRLDEGATLGTEVLPYFDSLLAKLTCRGRTFEEAVDRARRAVAEFRIRGIATNVNFLQSILDNDDFRAGNVTTSFIDQHPGLLSGRRSADRGTRLLAYLAETTVNRPYGPAPDLADPQAVLPSVDLDQPAPSGSRQLLDDLGPSAFAAALRQQTPIAISDTTFRDAHQSLLATRLRTADMLAVAPYLARLVPQLLSLEAWGGATYDVALRFLREDPWERLAALREAVPNICLQMLLRGRNLVGYTPYPDSVCRSFVGEAADTGIDIFRIFDALNDVDAMRPAIDAVLSCGRIAEGTLCYTGDLSDPSERIYTLDYYLSIADRLAGAGVQVLCVKDMAGLLRPIAAERLVTSLRERFDQPVHLHTHDTAGGQLATYLAALRAGVDAIDGAAAPLSGMTSQPSLSAIVAATNYGDRESGLSLDALLDLEPYFSAVRPLYRPFESGLAAPTGRVYRHEIPGGQLSNLWSQAVALGLGDRLDRVEELYATANDLLGDIIKVTPTSKVVGDLALYLAATGTDPVALREDPAAFELPDSVLDFLSGELGAPPGGWPEPFRTKALAGRDTKRATTKATAETRSADNGDRGEPAAGVDRRRQLSELLFPAPAREFAESLAAFGDLAVVPTSAFFYGLRLGEEIEVELSP
ncbi:MAG TPA: pyruvate carboxylase, partial [Acidimicrobiales bacterium]|nr:pyruvate carboxylase [Acidimicrobiales bacterium]